MRTGLRARTAPLPAGLSSLARRDEHRALPFATVGRLLDNREDFQTYFVTPLTRFGIKSLTTDSVVQQGCVLHEVGTIMSLGSYYKAIIGQYYNRWNREGGKWKIEFENILFPR